MGIAWTAGSKALIASKRTQVKIELKLLTNALQQYKVRFGTYPWGDGDMAEKDFSFGHKLSKVAHVNDPIYTAPTGVVKGDWNGDGTATSADKRPMFIHYREHGFNVKIFLGYVNNIPKVEEYTSDPSSSNCPRFMLCDPFDNPYRVSCINGKIKIFTPWIKYTNASDDIYN